MTADQYVEAQKNYEHEIMSQNGDKLNEKLISIGDVFTQGYYFDDDLDSVSLLLSDGVDEIEEDKVMRYMEQIIRGNPYISDMIILDKKTETVYTKSEILSQSFSESFDWFSNLFVEEILGGEEPIIFKGSHEGVGFTPTRDVCSFGHKLVNIYTLGYEESEAAVILNVPTETLFEHQGIHDEDQIGLTLVENEAGEIIYSSSPVGTEIPLLENYNEYEEDDRYIIRKKSLVSWSGMSYVSVLDREQMYQGYYLRMASQIAMIIVISIVVSFLFVLCAIYLMGKRIDRIVQFTQELEVGELNKRIPIRLDDEFTVIESGLNSMAQRLESHIEDKYVTDIKLKQAKIKSLQLQINPHFMFNTLETIRSVAVSNGGEDSANMVGVLGDMYRWNLRKPDIVTLGDELDYLDYYIELQELKYGRTLYCEYSVEHKARACEIPKLTIQPIVENCIQHGMGENAKELEIYIEAEYSEEYLSIWVCDNGLGMDNQKAEEIQKKIDKMDKMDNVYHIGLRNVNQRIKLLMGEQYGIYIKLDVIRGSVIEIRLPLMK